MKETRAGSPNGLDVYSYRAGEEYSESSSPRVDASLAAVFLREGWAEDIAEAPFRDPESAPGVVVAQPETAAPASEPAQPESSAAPVEAVPTPAVAENPAVPETPAEPPAAEPAKPGKKSAAPADPAPGSSEPS